MTPNGVQVGDVVLADRKGRRFYVIVSGKGQRELQVEPIEPPRHLPPGQGPGGAPDLAQAPAAKQRETNRRSTMSKSHEDGGPDELGQELVVLYFQDEINQALTGHGGSQYESPPQPRQHALTLAHVLLGYTDAELNGDEKWSCPIAGGRRTVALKPAAQATVEGGLG
jgi:hypothetical protein